MTKKLKLPIGILTVLAVFLAALLFLPLGATDGFAITASAEGEEFEGSFCPCDTKEYISNGNGTHNEVCSICYSVSDGDIPCKFENNNGFCSECGGYQPATDSNSDGVYEIGNAGQLYWFADKVNNDNANFGSANAKLTANITVNTGDVAGCDGEWQTGWRYWESIGKTDTNPYKGTFDGNGFYVSGLYFYDSATDYVGLFGYNKGTIKNVGVVNSYFKGRDNVGGVCGYNNYGTITNCYNTGTVDAGSIIGGVCGYNNYGTITNCYNTGEVSGTSSNKGGVCGYNFSGTIENCYYLDTTASDNHAISKTAEQFASGEVAYLLGQGCTIDDTFYSGNVWGQNIGNTEPIQAYPVLSGKTVYQCTPCTGKYSNNNSAVGEHTATYINGFGTCTDCGKEAYQPAVLNGTTYEIGNAGQLYWFAQQVNGGNTGISAILNNNITVNSGDVANCNGTKAEGWRDWTPIGNSESNAYTGTFDGNGKTISGLYYKNTGANNIGLFGYNKGTIKNVGVVNSYFKGNQHVGGVCGHNGENNYIQNCYNTGTISGKGNFVGGVCGQNYGTITNSYNTGAVSGTTSTSSYIGGVCGSNAYSGTITNCYNTGTVSGKCLYVGGVCGYNNETIKNSYNTGTVSGTDDCVGGVCGENDKTITNCYNTGTVSGKSKTSGGVCGFNNLSSSKIENCYNTGTVSGSSNVCGYNNGAIENCYYLAEAETDSFDGTTFKTAAQFTGGEVAYLLQGTQTTDVWGQTLTVENKQNYPVLGGAPVYKCTNGCTGKYSNEQYATGKHTAPDTYDNGFGKCTDCNVELYQPAEQTTTSGVYEISNAGQLYWFAQQVNGGKTGINAILTDNITVNTGGVAGCDGNKPDEWKDWTPIVDYTGTFDGANKTISGLYFNKTDANSVGLFGRISTGGTVKNVGVVDSYFSGSTGVGGVCGGNEGTIENCYNTGTVSGVVEASYVGGVCGLNAGTIENCYNTGTVSGAQYFGGVCGGNEGNEGKILNCYNTGAVNSSDEYASLTGGVCGINNGGPIANCYYFAESETDSFDGTTAKSATQFGSGEVAYLLSQGCTINETHYSGEVWGQDLSAENSYPVLGGAKVYQTLGCVGYSNTENETKEHTDENKDGECEVCHEKYAYIVSLLSEADGTSSVANPSGGGKFNAGETTTITAEALPGYTFNGWYNGDTLVNANLSFEFTVGEEDVTFTAKYTANADMTVTINGGDSYSIAVNNLEPSNYGGQQKESYAVGTKLTLTANGADFAYWENEAGSVLSRSASYTFTVVNNATVTAVYNTKTADKATVIFISGYDQIIARKQYADNEDVSVPAAPTKTGCDFAGWSVNGTVVAPTSEQTAEQYNEAVKTAIKNAITAVLATVTTDDDIVNVKAEYNNKVQNVTVTVTNGTGGGTYNINTVVTVTANDPESGFKFSHWIDSSNTILSYNTSYSFYAAKNITLTAVYVADTETVTAVGTTEIIDVSTDTTNKTITFVSLSTVPEGCTIQKAGVIATNNKTVADGKFDDTTAIIIRGDAWNGSSYRYSWTIGMNNPDVVVYARAYLVYTDKNGNTHTIYGAVKSTSVNR